MVEAGNEEGIGEEKNGNEVEVSSVDVFKVENRMIDVGTNEVSIELIP